MLASRRRSQEPILAAIVATSAVPCSACWWPRTPRSLWMVLLGLGQGGALGLALILPVLRGGEPGSVATLTAMTLSIGYLGAALGPWLAGVLHDATGGWRATLVFLLAVTVLQFVPGLPASRDRRLRARARPAHLGIMPGVPELVAPVVPAGRLRGQEQPRLTVDELVIRSPAAGVRERRPVEAYRDPASHPAVARPLGERGRGSGVGDGTGRPLGARAGSRVGRGRSGRGARPRGLRLAGSLRGSGEAAYWVLPTVRGRGVATRALGAVTSWMFAHAGLHRVSPGALDRQRGVVPGGHQAGFTARGRAAQAVLHADGWHDMHLHARLCDDAGSSTPWALTGPRSPGRAGLSLRSPPGPAETVSRAFATASSMRSKGVRDAHHHGLHHPAEQLDHARVPHRGPRLHPSPSSTSPAANLGARGVLMFRVVPVRRGRAASASSKWTLNGTVVSDITYRSDIGRTWHEIYEGNILELQDNELKVELTAGNGSVTVSDVTVWFQANI